jgi:hypothetical protein
MNAALTQFTLTHPGNPTQVTFSELNFLTPPSGGLYTAITDSDGSTPDTLDIIILSTTPGDGSAQSSVSGGAFVSWGAE